MFDLEASQNDGSGLATRLKALPKPALNDSCVQETSGSGSPQHGISELISVTTADSTGGPDQADEEPLLRKGVC